LARTCRGFEYSDFACFDAVIQGTHKLELDIIGSVGVVELLSWVEASHSQVMVEAGTVQKERANPQNYGRYLKGRTERTISIPTLLLSLLKFFSTPEYTEYIYS
jgi:hypothetical protein